MFQKKSLGQNFLHSTKALAEIIQAGDIQNGELVLEAGPGMGVLTAELLKAGAKVVAIEKDHRLIGPLNEKFKKEIELGLLKIIEGDILDVNPEEFEDLKLNKYKVIANIPYYITGFLFRKFLSSKNQPTKIVFMIQKEVADRIMARDGKESLMSLGVKAYGKPIFIATVSKGNFSPVPKVDSAILLVDQISRSNFSGEKHEEKFFQLAKKAFGQKRKMISSTLKIEKAILNSCGVSEKSRPEDLSVSDWVKISKN